MMLAKKWIVVGAVGTLFLLWLVNTFYQRELGAENARAFYNAEVSGRIGALRFGNGVCYVKLVSGGREWGFYPIVPKDADYQSFGMVARKGDSIMKHVNSDTVYLYSRGTVYSYTFHR